jgi:hypothetical protein
LAVRDKVFDAEIFDDNLEKNNLQRDMFNYNMKLCR